MMTTQENILFYMSSKLNDGVGKPSFELRHAWMNKEYYGM